MVQMTFEQYDAFIEECEKMEPANFWPSPVQSEIMENNPDQFVLYACFLYERNDPPTTKAEQYSKKTLRQLINDHLELIDGEED